MRAGTLWRRPLAGATWQAHWQSSWVILPAGSSVAHAGQCVPRSSGTTAISPTGRQRARTKFNTRARPADRLIVATYARGAKTYQGALRLAYIGYGAQSFMLGRSLYEDMLVGHWIKLNPEQAPRQLNDHRRMTLPYTRTSSAGSNWIRQTKSRSTAQSVTGYVRSSARGTGRG
jgi:hypothetical protein